MASGAQVAERMRKEMVNNLMKKFSSKEAVLQRKKIVNYLSSLRFQSKNMK